MEQITNSGQSQNLGTQQQGQKQADGPDEPVVNEQKQNEPVNQQDVADPENKESLGKEKGFKEGNKDDSDTEDDTAVNANNSKTK